MTEPLPAFAAVTRGTHVLGMAMIGLGDLSALAPALTGVSVIIMVGVPVASLW